MPSEKTTPEQREASELEREGWTFIGLAAKRHTDGCVSYHAEYASPLLMATKKEYGGLA